MLWIFEPIMLLVVVGWCILEFAGAAPLGSFWIPMTASVEFSELFTHSLKYVHKVLLLKLTTDKRPMA
jgi:hypothetical protein